MELRKLEIADRNISFENEQANKQKQSTNKNGQENLDRAE